MELGVPEARAQDINPAGRINLAPVLIAATDRPKRKPVSMAEA